MVTGRESRGSMAMATDTRCLFSTGGCAGVLLILAAVAYVVLVERNCPVHIGPRDVGGHR